MSNGLHWEETDLLVLKLDSPWAWEDFYGYSRILHQTIASAGHEVNVVILHRVDFPQGNPLRHLQSAMRDMPSNTGQIFIIPKDSSSQFNTFMNALMSVTEKVYPRKQKLRVAASLDDVRAWMDRQRVAH